MTKQETAWISLILIALSQGVVLLIAWRTRNSLPAPALPPGQLAYSPNLLLGAMIALGLTVAAFGFLMNLPMLDPDFLWLIIGISAFATAISVWCILAHEHERYEFSDDGLVYRTWLGKTKRLRWIDLRVLRHWDSSDCFRLITHDGDAATISTHLQGIAGFAAVALRCTPPEAMASAAREALKATAAGNPPRASLYSV
jgi:hypothetical protein